MSDANNSPAREMHRAEASASRTSVLSPFRAYSIVLLTLNTPREKFWGALLELNPAGISVRGISLESVDDCIQQIRAHERVDAAAMFFPMHRVERMELDARNGEVPSIAERFQAKAGVAPAVFFGAPEVQP